MPSKYLPSVFEVADGNESVMVVNARDLLNGYRKALQDYVAQEKNAAARAGVKDLSRYDDALRHFDDFVNKNRNSNEILNAAFSGKLIRQEDFVRIYAREAGKCGSSPAAALKFYGELGDKVKASLPSWKASAAQLRGDFKPMDELKRVSSEIIGSLKSRACAEGMKMARVEGLDAFLAHNPAMAFAATGQVADSQRVIKIGVPDAEQSQALRMQA